MNMIDSGKKYVFVINPKSFAFNVEKIQKFINSIKLLFGEITTEYNKYDFSIYESKFPRDAISHLLKIIENTPRTQTIRVFAVGGDGILFDCLNGIAGFENCELANIPLGKTNHFLAAFGYKNIKLFFNLKEQLSAPAIPTDVISCGTNCAINMVLAGLEARATFLKNHIVESIKTCYSFKICTQFAFILSGIFYLFEKKACENKYRIEFDGEETIEGNFITVNISNGSHYAGGKYSAQPQAIPDDGFLDVLCAHSIPFLRRIKIFRNYMKGKWKNTAEFFTYKKVKEIKISSETPIPVNLDGEIFWYLQMKLKIIPNAVKFVAVNNLTYKSEKV